LAWDFTANARMLAIASFSSEKRPTRRVKETYYLALACIANARILAMASFSLALAETLKSQWPSILTM
jgi:hypothetical protein